MDRGDGTANIIKLHRFSGKVSYPAYPDFETDPHPALASGIKLDMRSRQIDFYDYRQSANPPVLHRKEAFLALSVRAMRHHSAARPPLPPLPKGGITGPRPAPGRATDFELTRTFSSIFQKPCYLLFTIL